jgi:hypothetical protein
MCMSADGQESHGGADTAPRRGFGLQPFALAERGGASFAFPQRVQCDGGDTPAGHGMPDPDLCDDGVNKWQYFDLAISSVPVRVKTTTNMQSR